ncbi:PUB52 [Scenedesmus sp. PABB004]|nr:PUB52 [Scenedesmus sp. PABB004]
MAADGLQGTAEFDNELRLLPRLSHAHLVRLLGVCRSAAPPLRCLLYELMPGGNVEEQLAVQSGRSALPWWLRLRVAAQAASAVAYLHGLPPERCGPLLHRDIKPANIFLDGRLNAKLGDFGLAAPLTDLAPGARGRRGGGAGGGGGGGAAGETLMVGTFPYLPPEYRSSGVVGLALDVYALGVSLLQLATGALERLHDLVPRARAALGAGEGAGLLDARAGAWDAAAGERLLALGLWAAADAPEARPSAAVLAEQLAKLWLAADQCLAAARGQPQAAVQQVAVQQAPQQAAAAQQAAAPQAAPQGGGFWRFLTANSNSGA